MEYLFILGRNKELSVAEVLYYLKKEQKNARVLGMRRNSLLISCDELNPDKTILELGGTIAIGRLLKNGSLHEIKEYIRKENIYFSNKEKFAYSIFGFCEEEIEEEIYEEIKTKFKEERFKARFKRPGGTIRMQRRGIYEGSPSKLDSFDIVYFMFENESGGDNYFGVLQAISDSKEMERRDMSKPVRREELAISPRLAKILVNLSMARKEDILLDPFCGIGVILQEALLQGVRTYGIDKDKNAIAGATKNIQWLKSTYKLEQPYYKLVVDDSKSAPAMNFDAIASEPALGSILRRKISDREAESFMIQFERLIIPVLQRIKKIKRSDAKVAITFPSIRKFSPDIVRICHESGLRLDKSFLDYVSFPIKEFREKQFVSREIYVLF